MVPGDFAEKAMASLMSLHTELMDEKERRVELYRKLMEREQTVAELRMYIRLLEEKAEQKPPPEPAPRPMVPMASLEPIPAPRRTAPFANAAPPPREVESPVVPTPPRPPPASAYSREPTVAPPLPPRMARPRVDGWKTW
jgi:hypothetical protein